MYVRWKIKERSWDVALPEGPLDVAYLVESARIDGKPRQKTLAYLGSIRARCRTAIGPAYAFWQRVEAKLHPLHPSFEQRTSIERQLAERVPRPSEEAYQATEREVEAMIRRMRGVVPTDF